MSDIHDEETNSLISRSSELDELENGYESNDTDSMNLDDEEEEDEGGPFPMPCLSDRLLGGSLVLHIDQAGGSPVSAPGSLGLGANRSSTSTTTNSSDTASDTVSTRAVMGDTPSTTEANAFPPGDEDAADNSSQVSMADSEAERVRRIHNSIFSSLENDLAELVRIREETIQFLETGVRSENMSGGGGGDENLSESDVNNGSGDRASQPFSLRERLTYYTRPLTSGDVPQGNLTLEPASTAATINEGEGTKSASMAAMQARFYTPLAKFDNAPPAKPAKPYLEVGVVGCDEKAAAARKVLDKLQYGDPEDESACFVRRFWRESSTVVDNSPASPGLSLDVAAIAQRTASLQASLEEAFDGLRLRLQQVQTDAATSGGEDGQDGERNNGESENENNTNAAGSNNNEDFQAWDEETSIMNNPLNYDIWNELEDGNEAGPTITARINMAEQRALATSRTRQSQSAVEAVSNNRLQRPVTTSTVGVGTTESGRLEGAELDDDSTDDEEMMRYFQVRCNDLSNHINNNRSSGLPRTSSQESRRAFFQEIGISEEMGQDLFNMFTLSEEDVQLPANLELADGNCNSGMSSSEIPEPLFPRNGNLSLTNSNNSSLNDQDQGNTSNSANQVEDDGNESCSTPPPQIPLFDTTPCIHFVANREDDCSTRVYLDENYLNFPIHPHDESHNQDLEDQE